MTLRMLNFKLRYIAIITIVVLISGCATYNPVPDGYTGRTARINDTFLNKTDFQAEYFALTKVDGKVVESSFGATRSAYYGNGTNFSPEMVSRRVPSHEQTFTIKGYIFYPTDLQLLVSSTRSVKGEVTFTPEGGEYYFVKGEIKDDVSSVWIEDSDGTLIGQKFLRD